MNIPKPIKSIQNFFAPSKNSIGDNLGKDFLRFGNRKPLIQDWSKVVMSDKDLYTGYSYAAINNRANKTAQLATDNVMTSADKTMMKEARAKGEQITHPYIDIIDNSKTFSNHYFWHSISTFLDLEGVYYLMAVRTVEGDRVGRVQEFKLLNPYNVRRIRNKETGEVGGYVESRDGMVREIPPQMIIDIRNLNPFSTDDPYAMTDAAKEFQYTLKQAGDYTRHSLKNNMAAPGILSTDMLLDTEQFENFVARVTNQEKGLPLFGNGAGAITWDAMQIDLDKASLDKINEINRSTLFAVSGVGKTMMSIEESGTTRETAKVQKDLFVEAHIIPQLQLILDALNQDYKRFYEADYDKNGYTLYIDNPLGTDREAELKDIEIREKSFDMYNSLVNKGYKPELAAKYTDGEITLEELGQPTEEPKQITPIEPKQKADEEPPQDDEEADNKLPHTHSDVADRVTNEFNEETQGLIAVQQSSLQNEVTRVETGVVMSVMNKLTKSINAFDETNDIITKTDQNKAEKELQQSLEIFYLALIPIFANLFAARRTKEFGMMSTFEVTPVIRRQMKELAGIVSESHISTILEDLRLAVKSTYDDAVQARLSQIEATGRKVTDADLVFARKRALEGDGQARIVSAVRQKYTEISEGRTKTIARTEASRAFNQSQLQSDLQFVEQNGLEGKAYKKWVTRNDNPCQFCKAMADQPPIPIRDNFVDLGDTIEVEAVSNGKVKLSKMSIDFEPVSAGLLHPNCGCTYKLIVTE